MAFIAVIRRFSIGFIVFRYMLDMVTLTIEDLVAVSDVARVSRESNQPLLSLAQKRELAELAVRIWALGFYVLSVISVATFHATELSLSCSDWWGSTTTYPDEKCPPVPMGWMMRGNSSAITATAFTRGKNMRRVTSAHTLCRSLFSVTSARRRFLAKTFSHDTSLDIARAIHLLGGQLLPVISVIMRK